MFYKYLINSIIIVFFSQKLIANSFKIKKSGFFFKNVCCVLCFEEFVGLVLTLFCMIFKLKDIYVDNIVCIITYLFFFIVSLACYFVHEFRGTNVNFQDIKSISTAGEVAGGYKFEIKIRFVVVLFVYLLCIVLNIVLNKYNLYEVLTNKMNLNWINGGLNLQKMFGNLHVILLLNILGILLNLKGRLLFLIFFFFYLRNVISNSTYNYGLFAGEKEGYIYNLFSSMPFFHKKKLNSKDREIYAEYLSNQKLYNEKIFSEENIKSIKDKPYVICLMNESFGSSNQLLKTNESVTPYFDKLKNVIKGYMYVNTIGGGTCNTEYDFLTYSNSGDCDFPIYPFNDKIKNKMFALPTYFKNLGYSTMAFHPYTKTNYNRNVVYENLGFDTFIGLEDMEEKSYIRNFISDESMYNEIIKRVDDSIKRKEKLFLYGVSIQNHGGYDFFFGEKIKNEDSRFIGEDVSLDSYMSLLKKSDEAIHILVDYVKKSKEHIVLLFFGDHNASFESSINRKLYGEDDIYEFCNAYKVPFFIYDNKQKLNEFVDKFSPNFLAMKLIKTIGLPMDYDLQCMSKLHENIQAMNYHRMIKKGENTITKINLSNYKILQKNRYYK